MEKKWNGYSDDFIREASYETMRDALELEKMVVSISKKNSHSIDISFSDSTTISIEKIDERTHEVNCSCDEYFMNCSREGLKVPCKHMIFALSKLCDIPIDHRYSDDSGFMYKFLKDRYLIMDLGHGENVFYRPSLQGHTNDISKAGIYSSEGLKYYRKIKSFEELDGYECAISIMDFIKSVVDYSMDGIRKRKNSKR